MHLPSQRALLMALSLFVTPLAVAGVAGPQAPTNWPQWRGAAMNGLAGDANPPVSWSEKENIAWKVELPGTGSSTPIAWDGVLYVQTAEPLGDRRQRFALLAIDQDTGAVLWDRTLREEDPRASIQENNSWASGSAVTDGERLYAFFGSRGIYALDFDGDMLWEQDLGDLETRGSFGEGNSPGLHGDTLLVNWDQESDSFLAALDTATGQERWRVQRDEPTTWYTPVVAEVNGVAHVITMGTRAVRGYELATGELLWHGPGLTLNAIPSPVVVDGVAYLTAGYRGTAFMAVDLSKAAGDLEDSDAILWRYDQDTPYVSSPIVTGGVAYFVKDRLGILTGLDAATGERLFGPERLDELQGVYASAVAASGRIYWPGRDGAVAVLREGPELEILAINHLDDGFDASPVVLGDTLYLRGTRFLYRIEAR